MITTDDKNTPNERKMSNMSDRDLFLVMIKDIEKQLSTVDLAFKGINELLKKYEGRIAELEAKSQPQDHDTDSSKKVKPTRYYPNGAYMDEPEEKSLYYVIARDGYTYEHAWDNDTMDNDSLKVQNIFPTKEAAEKELKRQKLTAKMYRDMRDESINGDWDINLFQV